MVTYLICEDLLLANFENIYQSKIYQYFNSNRNILFFKLNLSLFT